MEFDFFFLFQSAELLLFVIDNRTRAVSSMIETAYLTGKHSRCKLRIAAWKNALLTAYSCQNVFRKKNHGLVEYEIACTHN